MTLILDSAFVDDARRAAALGFVIGITTNPALLAKVELPAGLTPRERTRQIICGLCDVFPGTVMVQLTAETVEAREQEARELLALRPAGQIGLKIPSVPENFALTRKFSAEGYTVGMTTIFSPEQVYLACEAGATYVFPYVNRSTRLLGDGFALVRRMRAVVDALKAPTQIVAASIKTPQEAIDTILAGAHGLTIPLSVMLAMGQHPLSEQAIEEFARS